MSPEARRLERICHSEQVPEGRTFKFSFQRDAVTVEAFVARLQGRVVAYENVCRHVPISLDYGNGDFFTPDGRYFICQSHGALYEPLTGLCVRGPCEGRALKPVPVQELEESIWLLPVEP